MSLTLIKEDGTGKADANSYADEADFAAYNDAHVDPICLANADVYAPLIMATRVIDAEYQFSGARAVAGQALQWPRVGCPDVDGGEGAELDSASVPAGIVRATCDMARELYKVDRTAAPPGEGISEQRNADASAVIYSKSDTRPIISHLAQAMLAKFGRLMSERPSGGMVRLVRV